MANTLTYGLKLWRFAVPKLWNLIPDSSIIQNYYTRLSHALYNLYNFHVICEIHSEIR